MEMPDQKTRVYKSYNAYRKCRIRSVYDNGVSEEFAAKNPDYVEENKTNVGCWNCKESVSCGFCRDCENCSLCLHSELCINCEECEHCNACVRCISCENCTDCENCKLCYHCTGCYSCEKCSRQRNKTNCTKLHPTCPHCENKIDYDDPIFY